MELTHRGTTYTYDYDFAPNDGTSETVVTVVDGETLDGQLFITRVAVNGRQRPVPTALLALLRQAAAREELRQNRLAWQRLEERLAAESRRARISVVPRRG